MHGLLNYCLEQFLRQSYGEDMWDNISSRVGIQSGDLLNWGAASKETTEAIFLESSKQLEKSRQEFLEDMGVWLTRQEPIRRLLRFSGSRFEDFIQSLREIVPRMRMIIPNLNLRSLGVKSPAKGHHIITSQGNDPDLSWIVCGVVRGMADDYGALAVTSATETTIDVYVALPNYAEKRNFHLSREISHE